jgi:hypothetical protein
MAADSKVQSIPSHTPSSKNPPHTCAFCATKAASKRCGKCQSVFYCDAKCQLQHSSLRMRHSRDHESATEFLSILRNKRGKLLDFLDRDMHGSTNVKSIGAKEGIRLPSAGCGRREFVDRPNDRDRPQQPAMKN